MPPALSETDASDAPGPEEELAQARQRRDRAAAKVTDSVGERVAEVFANFLEK